ncbi:MAG: Na+/H+ antiporter NhaA [Rhodobacteraceae bacterium]|nr:Na+/H+ antiporter NhaA [Paracoccaceae bacterium]
MAVRVFGVSSEVAAGLVLAAGAVLGLIFENIAFLSVIYDRLLDTVMTIAVGESKIEKPLLLWINDGLMAIFFLYVALEIKKEIVRGALSTWTRAAMPVYGAIGGIVAPALVFIGIVGIDSAEARGWAIPAATDIAFALGVLSLLGNRVPPELKTFLLALAVVDDLAAIMIIAIFYTAGMSFAALVTAAVASGVLFFMNRRRVTSAAPYIIVGLIMWAAVLKSGVHATLAGVVLGLFIPISEDKNGRSLAIDMKNGLHNWVAFLIMPVFAFANAGVPLAGFTLETLMQPLPLAIAAGLFIGKQIGVFGCTFAAVKLGLAFKPDVITWRKVYGTACLAGIGFTMSLFIGGLAFPDPEPQNLVRAGVLVGSLASGVLGMTLLMWSRKNEPVRTFGE